MSGNLATRAIAATDMITPPLVGETMLEVLRDSILSEKVFQTMFGRKHRTDPEKSRIFLNKMPSLNETILPAWEFRFSSEILQGAELLLNGKVRSRIFLPNNLDGDLAFHRRIALAVGRYFNSAKRLDDFLGKVSGLTEFGENLDFGYDLLFVQGGQTIPVITIDIDYSFDMHRFRTENPATDFDAELDARLLREISTKIEISGDDDATGDRVDLLPDNC